MFNYKNIGVCAAILFCLNAEAYQVLDKQNELRFGSGFNFSNFSIKKS
jgi:hypothetical protein